MKRLSDFVEQAILPTAAFRCLFGGVALLATRRVPANSRLQPELAAPQSSGAATSRGIFLVEKGRRDESRRGTHECVRHENRCGGRRIRATVIQFVPTAATLCIFLMLLAACSHRADVDSQLETAVPTDAVIAGEANLDRLRGTPLWRVAPPGLVEPFREASRVLAASSRNEWLVLAHGSLVQMPPGGRWLAPGIAVAGSIRLATEAERRWRSAQAAGPLIEFAAAHAAGSVLWIAARGGVELPLSGNYANLNRLLLEVEYAVLSVNLDGECRFRLVAESRGEAAAQRFEQTLRAMLSLAAMAEARHAELAGALNAAAVHREGRKIDAQLSGSMDTIASLLGQAPR